MAGFDELLKSQISCATDIFSAALGDVEVLGLFNRSLAYISSLEKIFLTVQNRREFVVFGQALQEAQYALMSAAMGNYRNSFSSLRLFFELSLAAIEFSSNERLMRGWENSGEDIYWSRISQEDTGIFSKNYTRLFFEGLVDNAPHFGNLARKVYRECSEYVHGNPSAYKKLPQRLAYDRAVAIEWAQKLETIQLILLFAFSVRYLKELSANQKEPISAYVLGELGHIEIIRATFGGAVGG